MRGRRGAVRALAGIPHVLPAAAVAVAALAALEPSMWLATHSDLLLAALVLASGLGIGAAELGRVRANLPAVAALSLAPMPLIGACAWVIGRPFSAPVRDGLLAVGLASSEVAAVGLVAIARADAAVTLGVVVGSLIAAAVLGPVAVSALGAGAGVHVASLLGRFGLVVIAPMAAGLALRSRPRVARTLEALDEQREGVAALVVLALVYAALSGARGGHGLLSAALASAALLASCGMLALLWYRSASPHLAIPGAMAIGLRDFAVGAVLAAQAFGPAAATVPGVYGVLMLIAGAATAGRLRRRADVGG